MFRIGESIQGQNEAYEIKSILGKGGSSVVFEVIGATSRKIRVAKVAEFPEGRSMIQKRFKAEADILRKLSEVNRVCHIIDETEISLYGKRYGILIMEKLHGNTLGEYLDAQGEHSEQRKIPWQAALLITRQIIEWIQLFAEKEIIHRDIKPDNIFICDPSGTINILTADKTQLADLLHEGHLKILPFDFNASRDLSAAERLTEGGVMVGTVAYMDPRPCLSKDSGLLPDEMYSVGIMLYELIMGKLPFNLNISPDAQTALLTKCYSVTLPDNDEMAESHPFIFSWISKAIHLKIEECFPSSAQALHELKHLIPRMYLAASTDRAVIDMDLIRSLQARMDPKNRDVYCPEKKEEGNTPDFAEMFTLMKNASPEETDPYDDAPTILSQIPTNSDNTLVSQTVKGRQAIQFLQTVLDEGYEAAILSVTSNVNASTYTREDFTEMKDSKGKSIPFPQTIKVGDSLTIRVKITPEEFKQLYFNDEATTIQRKSPKRQNTPVCTQKPQKAATVMQHSPKRRKMDTPRISEPSNSPEKRANKADTPTYLFSQAETEALRSIDQTTGRSLTFWQRFLSIFGLQS